MKIKILLCVCFAISLLAVNPVNGESVGQIIESIWSRGLYFDKVRFDTNTVRGFTNDAQTLIATLGKTNQADTVIIMDEDEIQWRLPSDYFDVQSVTLSKDQTKEDAQLVSLRYVPITDWGRDFTPDTRTGQYTIWADSLLVDYPAEMEDTLIVRYLALPTIAGDTSTAVDLPARYIPMLKEVVVQMCLERITFPDRSPRNEGLSLTKLVQGALLNREADSN